MATITSNSYAEKVFAEHPIALWSLDEGVYYGSFISETNREISSANGWTVTGATPAVYGNVPGESSPLPVFETSVMNKITLGSSPSSPAEIDIKGPTVIASLSDVDTTISNFTIGAFLYPFSEIVNVNIGFEYYIPATSSTERVTQGYLIESAEQWAFISGTFDFPDVVFSNIKIVFEVTIQNAIAGDQILIHGITVGQKSEQFNVESLGHIPQSMPNTISVNGEGVAASIYGLQDVSGYYMFKDNIPCAKNSGLPMVYGTSSSTVLTPNEQLSGEVYINEPSLILPGYGFLNENNKYLDLTLEMWMKIQSSATTPKRIVGPVGSSDGLYVNDAFLVLKIGDYFGSYYVGEWDRPMLVAIRMSSTKAELVINGEAVIEMNIDIDTVTLASKYNNDNEDQDWIGFYAYSDVPVIELDCVGIYPYKVPNIVEKRRWIYGQGVELSEGISGSNLGTSVAFDYTFANYAKNYLYPDLGKWNQGVPENIVVGNTTLSLPQYSLPSLVFTNKTTEEWYADNSELTALFGSYTSMKPNSDWNNTEGHIYFPSFNLLQQDLKAFYFLAESNNTVLTKQTLFVIENPITGELIECTLEDDTTSYTYTYLPFGSTEPVTELLYSDVFHTPGDFLFVGLELDKFSRYIGGRVANFLGSKQQLRMYVAGRPDYTQTFAGNIYRIGFCTARNLEKISNVYAETGLPVGYNAIDQSNIADAQFYNTISWEQYWDGGDQYFGNSSAIYTDEEDGGGVYSLLVSYILAHVASYTLTPKTFLNNFMLDVGVNSYWQDYVPLNYFAKYVTDGTLNDQGQTNKYLDLDFIQFNVDYPAINKFLANSYDTTNSLVRTFISFQELNDAPNIGTSRYTKIVLPPKNGVVAPTANEWQTRYDDADTPYVEYTKYEVVNDTIIYPPKDVDFNTIGIVLHIEIVSNGIVENPVIIKSLQLSSQALNSFVPNAVGTRFGTNVYPYKKSSELYDYKARNPFSIYKKSTPYFYMTSNSGMQLRGFYDGDTERGIEIPINVNAASFYKASAWQFAIRYNNDLFPERVTEIFEIYAKSKTKEDAGDPTYLQHIKFYMKPNDSEFKRGKIYAIDAETGLEVGGITYYINGKKVHAPVIDSNMWTVLGFTFSDPLDFSGYVCHMSITGPLLFNNISYYQISEADEASRSVYRKWFAVKTENGVDETWDYWKTLDGDLVTPGTQTFTWKNVLFISSNEFVGVNGSSIYKKYTGSNRIVVDSESEFRINSYEYLTYKDASWQSSVVSPA